jgi:predicted transcriptional regulator of viral defense system
MMRDAFTRVHEIALDHHGYFTMEQARDAGVEPHAVLMMQRRGTIERVAHGLYFNSLVPASALGPYMGASLWPRSVRGVLSHQTALELLGLSDASPDRIHLTLPKHLRVRRKVPAQYALHHADLGPRETTVVEGIPVTTAARTIRDCHAAHLGPALLRQAIEDGRRTGRLTEAEAELLTVEVLATHQEAERGRP